MNNYGRGTSLTSLIIKGIIALIGLFILIAVAKTVLSVVVSILALFAIGIGIWLLIKFLSRNSRRYY